MLIKYHRLQKETVVVIIVITITGVIMSMISERMMVNYKRTSKEGKNSLGSMPAYTS
jgi:predicted glycosyl hydrolase (DUF1957 family)